MTMKQLVFPSLFTSFPQLKSLLATKFYCTSSEHLQGGYYEVTALPSGSARRRIGRDSGEIGRFDGRRIQGFFCSPFGRHRQRRRRVRGEIGNFRDRRGFEHRHRVAL